MFFGPNSLVQTVFAACAVGLLAIGGFFLALRLRRAQARELAAIQARDAAQEAEQVSTRRLRLAAHDLRGIGMNLHGHGEHLAVTQARDISGIVTAAADLLDMADDLQDHVTQPGVARVLREEDIDLAVVVDEAVLAVTAAMGPGQRNWRLAPDLRGTLLRGDRRALRHVLTRVLSAAVRSTRHSDWIDVSLRAHRDGLAVVVEDEGAGMATPDTAAAAPTAGVLRDSRGIGLRLTLARALMQAHGGQVDVEAHAGVGTRVSLIFPAARVRQSAIRAGNARPGASQAEAAISRPSPTYVAQQQGLAAADR